MIHGVFFLWRSVKFELAPPVKYGHGVCREKGKVMGLNLAGGCDRTYSFGFQNGPGFESRGVV